MFHTFSHASIKAIAGAYGAKLIDFQEQKLVEMDDVKYQRLLKTLGFYKIRYLERPKSTLDMMLAAAKNVMQATNVSAKDIDGLICVSQSPDNIIPPAAYFLQEYLDLNEDVFIDDALQGCAGYTFGLFKAFSLIEQGICQQVLLCVGDVCRYDELTHVSDTQQEQLANALIFGDGAAATLITRSDVESPSPFIIKNHGHLGKAIISEDQSLRFLRANPPHQKKVLPKSIYIDGMALAEYTLNQVKNSVLDLLDYALMSQDDLSYFISHQGNRTLLKALATSLGTNNKKLPFLSSELGNLASASIPVVLSEYFDSLPELRNKLTMLTGFGVGLSTISCITDLRACIFAKPVEV